MTDHTDEPAGGDRTLTWLPIAAAAAVALVVGLVIVLAGPGDDNQLGSKRDSHGALVCPDSYQLTSDDAAGKGWVPVNPAGLDGKKRLVPDAAPEHVTVCRYVAKRAGTLAGTVTISLDGTRVLSGGQRAMTRELSGSRKASGATASCPDGYRVGDTSYLAGLTFRTGIVWVSASGLPCQRVSNGQFSTAVDVTKQLAEAFDTNTWPTG